MRLGHKTDAKRRRYTDGSEKTPSFQHSNVNPGNNKVTCCRLGSAARKDTRSIESRAAKTALRLHVLETKAMQKVDTAPMGQKKHHPFGVRTTPLVTTRSHAAKAAARPYKTRFLLKARTICFRSTQTRFSLFHFGMHPLGIIMFALSPEMKICTAFLLGVRPHPNGPRAMFFQSLQDKNGIAEARCFRKHSQSAALSPRASSKSIASSGGAPVLVRKDTHAGPQRLPAAAVSSCRHRRTMGF